MLLAFLRRAAGPEAGIGPFIVTTLEALAVMCGFERRAGKSRREPHAPPHGLQAWAPYIHASLRTATLMSE